MIAESSLDLLFRHARSQNGWRDEAVPDALLVRLYDLVKYGPTSANSSPARFLFLRTPAAKERLRPHLDSTNVDKVMTAPVTAVIGFDTRFVRTWEFYLAYCEAAFACGNTDVMQFTLRRV